MIGIGMADDKDVEKGNAFASEKRNQDEATGVGTAAKRWTGVEHRRMPMCLKDQCKPLSDIQHVQIDAIFGWWQRPIENDRKASKQSKPATRPARRQD